MGAPIVYRWDDDGAPIMTGEAGSFVNVLKACLVNGYGTKPAAGWTLEYDNVDNTSAAFRNNPITGTGFFFSVEGQYSNSNVHIVQGYETMSALATGIGPFRDPTVNQYFITATTSNSVPRIWILVADDRAFYFMSYVYTDATNGADDLTVGSNYCCTPLFFGDIESLLDDDPYGCALITSNTASTAVGTPLVNASHADVAVTINNSKVIARHLNGLNVISTFNILNCAGPIDDARTGDGGLARDNGLLIAQQPFITDSESFTIRGKLPGFYHMGHNYDEFGPFEIVTIGGKTLMALRGCGSAQYNYAGFFLDLGTTFRG